ncbi:MAG: restriction endonuclease subunit S, partial [Roseiarcus sp.]
MFEPTPAIEARYLQYYLHSQRFVGWISATTSGDRPRVGFETIAGFAIPLAPLPEQRRIVARIDALFAEIAEGEAALADARKGLEIFRRALLKAALSGELTRDWRETNPASETGGELLLRIAKGRAKMGSLRRTTESNHLKLDLLPKLPHGWAWAMLGDVGDIVGGVTVDTKRKPEDPIAVPYLRVANVQRGHIDLSEVKSIVVEKSAAQKLRLIPGDLLLNEGGDRDKIGRGWV